MGFQKQVIKEGNGQKPTKGQNVTVHCTGYGKNKDLNQKFWSTKGEFDAMLDVGSPLQSSSWSFIFFSPSLLQIQDNSRLPLLWVSVR
jgi:hypothetical protein